MEGSAEFVRLDLGLVMWRTRLTFEGQQLARRCALVLLFLPYMLLAQPGGPDLTFVLVRDAKGRPMKGPLVENAMLCDALRTKRTEPWSVELHFTVSAGYPYGPEKPGDHKQWSLSVTEMEAPGVDPLVFSVIDCWCTDLHVQVIQGDRIMRIDLPDAPAERWALVQRVMARSGDHPSPEVFRFRAGRYTYAELADDPAFDKLEQRIVDGLEHGRDADYRRQLAEQEEYYRDQPAIEPPEAQSQVPVEIETYQREVAARPALKVVEIEQQHADTVWLRITGGVILDGGCASGMPQFSIEMLSDSGWVERLPFPVAQMDCGMPWAEWNERTVMLHPLRWWVSARSPEGRKELMPGTYRLVLIGANGELVRTAPFVIPDHRDAR
jgi:hypothetical protein